MKTTSFVLAAAVLPAATLASRHPLPTVVIGHESSSSAVVTHARAAEINARPGLTWTASAEGNPFLGWKRSDVARVMGTRIDPESLAALPRSQGLGSDPVPPAFSWRNHTFPAAGGPCVGPVLDQGPCGSCWSHGAVEALGDRVCIATQGKVNVPLSPTNLMECDSGEGGCDGGMLTAAWDYLKSTGVSSLACTPSPWAPCDPTPCLPPFKPTPACNTTCSNGSPYTLTKAASVYSVGGWFERADDIAREIMKNGPVEAAFTVYSDFVTYKSGVYKHETGGVLGGHAIKIVGFGTTPDGVKYWEVQNSWNKSWGEDGFFRILRGSDECGIESNVVAGLPDVSGIKF